jgi:hypothetical protein
VLEWLFAWPAFGIADDSSLLLMDPVGALAAVSEAPDVEEEDDVSEELPDDVVPVGALDVASLGCPAPVGLFGVAGSGGGADELVDGVTGGVALLSVAVSVRLQPAASTAAVASATARAMGFMETPLFWAIVVARPRGRASCERYADAAMPRIGSGPNRL